MKQQHRIQVGAFARLLQALALALLLAAPAQAREPAARVQFVVGQVAALAQDGDRRRLRRGDEVFSGDTLESAAASTAQLVFSDSSRLAVRANTIVKIENYRYDAGNRSNSSSLIALLGGAVRSITGLIGKYNRRAVQLVTPVATIGIRGTDFEVIHVTGDSRGLTGTYNRVYSGATTLQSARGSLALDAGRIGYVAGTPGNAAAPVLIDALPGAVADMIAHALPDGGELEVAGNDPALDLLDESLASDSVDLDLNAGLLADSVNDIGSTSDSVLNSFGGGLGGAGGGVGGQLPGSGSLPLPLDTNQLGLPQL